MELQVRQASLEDLSTICEIEENCQLYPFSKAKIESCFSNQYYNLVVCHEGKIVGFVLCFIGYEVLEIHNLCIYNTYRRKGLAKLLINELVKLALAEKKEKVILDVRKSNISAILLYQASGFYQVGQRKNYYPNAGNTFEDAILMNLDICGSL